MTPTALLDAAAGRGSDPSVVPVLEQFRDAYADLDAEGRLAVFRHLGEAMEVDAAALPPVGTTPAELMRLREALTSPRLELLSQFVNMPGGIKFLVDLREDLRRAIKAEPDVPSLRAVDGDLLGLFRSWFNFGFLELRPISWEATPAAQLEKVMKDDVVHPMTDWRDLRRRLEKDRLCYAFFHPNMPGEPLIFVEIALTRTIASSIDQLLSPMPAGWSAADATTAIFYSINNTQPGLAGVSLGNSLIKQVVHELQRRLPNLKRFSTLSPMPGFRDRYVQPLLADDKSAAKFDLTSDQLAGMFADADVLTAGDRPLLDTLRDVLDSDAWTSDPVLQGALKPGLLRLAHHYLTREKRGQDPVNPVANFHLKNGAVLYNLNFMSNTRPKGMAESFGMTVNYHYDLAQIDTNQQRARDGEVVVSPQLERMLRLGVSA